MHPDGCGYSFMDAYSQACVAHSPYPPSILRTLAAQAGSSLRDEDEPGDKHEQHEDAAVVSAGNLAWGPGWRYSFRAVPDGHVSARSQQSRLMYSPWQKECLIWGAAAGQQLM